MLAQIMSICSFSYAGIIVQNVGHFCSNQVLSVQVIFLLSAHGSMQVMSRFEREYFSSPLRMINEN